MEIKEKLILDTKPHYGYQAEGILERQFTDFVMHAYLLP